MFGEFKYWNSKLKILEKLAFDGSEIVLDEKSEKELIHCPLLVNMVRAGKLGVKSGEGFYDYSESRKAEHVSAQFKA